MLLTKIAEEYIAQNDLSVETADDYLWIAKQFDACTGSICVHELKALHVNAYLSWLKRPHLWRGKFVTCEPTTVAGRRTKLLVLWRWAYTVGLTDNRPDDLRIMRIRVPEPDPQGWTSDEVGRLATWCETNMPRMLRRCRATAGFYLAALFLFLWDTGMRLGDAERMRFSDVETGTVKWRQNKTGRWHRAELKPRTRAAIARIRTCDREFIWPRTAKTRTPLYRMIQRAVKGAGLTGSAKWIRSGGATDCELNEKGSAPDYLGHAPGSRVAYRHYVKREAQIRMASPSDV